MRPFLTIILSILFTQYSYSQEKESNKYIPGFSSSKSEKLALRLTRNLPSDSAKVAAIHNWITHHIKYDIKKSEAFNYSRISVNKILRSRKATCTGYCDLFNELCKHAQITSIAIPGYSKNENVDLNDKLYLDEHIWNAVYVNNKWKLVDACWDAGYIEFFKRTFTGHFVHFFTLNKNDILKYKPHFIAHPGETYFYKDGNDFKADHIPANPLWQMVYPLETIEQAEADSAFYLRRRATGNSPPIDTEMNRERLMMCNMGNEARDIADGISSYKFNHKNQYGIGNSYFLSAIDIFKKLDAKENGAPAFLNQCDSIEVNLNYAILHYDSNSFFLSIQKQELTKNNDIKKSILTKENQRLIASTKEAGKNMDSGKKICASGKTNSIKINKKCQGQLKKLAKKTKFYKTPTAKKINPVDSAGSSQKIGCILDSLDKIQLRMARQFENLDSLYFCFENRINNYSYQSKLNNNTASNLCLARTYYEDDLDYVLRTIKDSLMKHKFKDDSLLLEGNRGFIIKLFYTEFSRLDNDFNKFYAFQNDMEDEFTKLKKSCVMENKLTQQYIYTDGWYRKKLETFNMIFNTYGNKWKVIIKSCQSPIRDARKEEKTYSKEKQLELKMFSIRSTYINKHYNALMSINIKQIKNCEKIKKDIQKFRQKNKRI